MESFILFVELGKNMVKHNEILVFADDIFRRTASLHSSPEKGSVLLEACYLLHIKLLDTAKKCLQGIAIFGFF